MIDSLKVTATGTGAILIDVWNVLPDIVSLTI